jgi:hypothetical protein
MPGRIASKPSVVIFGGMYAGNEHAPKKSALHATSKTHLLIVTTLGF